MLAALKKMLFMKNIRILLKNLSLYLSAVVIEQIETSGAVAKCSDG